MALMGPGEDRERERSHARVPSPDPHCVLAVLARLFDPEGVENADDDEVTDTDYYHRSTTTPAVPRIHQRSAEHPHPAPRRILPHRVLRRHDCT